MNFWAGAERTLLGPYREVDSPALSHAVCRLSDALQSSGRHATIFCFPARTRWGAGRKLRRRVRRELVDGMGA